MSTSAESAPSVAIGQTKAFTAKALMLGLAGAVAIAWVNNFNGNFLHSPDLIGNHLPTGPLALVMLLGVLWNPLVGRWCRPLLFNPREMTVVLVIMMACSWLPASGFYRYFQRMVALPAVQLPGKPNWQTHDVLGQIPERLFPLLRDPERFALVTTLEAQPIADPAVSKILSVIDTAALTTEPLTSDADSKALDVTRTRIAAHAVNDARWAAAKNLVDGLPSLVPTAAEQTVFAVAFRQVRDGYNQRLPAVRREYERVYGGFVQGLAVGDRKVPISEIPWTPWLTAMAYWAPMVLLFMVLIVALSLIVHRQWSRHEQISYPLATVTTALVETLPGRTVPAILANRLFWFGFIPILALHMINYSSVWFPSYVPRIELGWGFGSELRAIFPVLNSVSDPWVTWGKISFLIVGLSFFISSEMSLSMGLSSLALLFVNLQTYSITGGSPDMESARSGAYFAYAGILLYTGRTYYWAVLIKALGIRTTEDSDREPVWAARIFMLAFIAFVGVLAGPFGMDWFVAALFSLTTMVLFLVFTRIICETGTPFMQAGWYPGTFLTSTLGFSALGSIPLVMVCYLSPILAQDPREALMPYVQNGLKMAENTGVRRTPLAWIAFGAMAIALVICFVSWTKGIYQDGSFNDGWANVYVPSIHLDAASRGLEMLSDTGQRAAADATSGIAKIGLISSVGHGRELTWIFLGAAGVILFSTLRFSFGWWPLHPVIFLVWGAYPMLCSWPSFMLGWAIKQLVVKFAGGKSYNQLKPLFIGVILGEIFAVAVVIVVGFLYYLSTGTIPKSYWILPG